MRQLLAVTNQDPVAWCASNDFNLLVSHHPTDWLHATAREVWESDINPPDRFNAHLFGHMHEPGSKSVAISGAKYRRSYQGASLFGLDKTDDGKVVRTQGYSLSRLAEAGARQLITVWPRRFVKLANGSQRLMPDQAFDLDEDNSYTEHYDLAVQSPAYSTPRIAETASIVRVMPEASKAEVILDKISHHLPPAHAHLNVRKIEQRNAVSSLKESRSVWLISDWGMGVDGFIWSCQGNLEDRDASTFRIDFQSFRSRATFLDHVQRTLDCTFQSLCDLIAEQGSSYLILDDVPIGSVVDMGPIPVEQDVERLVAVILEYCPDARVIIRARQMPSRNKIPVTELRPLDEADVAIYLTESDLGGSSLLKPDVVERLFRYTDGVPSKLDKALRELEVGDLTEVVSANSDLTSLVPADVRASPALAQAVENLRQSSEPDLRRAFELLKALSVFPQGEQMERIKRFNGASAFYTSHALELLDRALISSFASADVGIKDGGLKKTLVVLRPVREYLRSRLDEAELQSLDQRAFDLYFGPQWKSTVLKSPAAYRFSDSLQNGSSINNASTLVVRYVGQASREEGGSDLLTALGVASAFLELLLEGDHFRSVNALCEDLLPLIPLEGFEHSRSIISYEHAKSLRMTGDDERARDILEKLSFKGLSRTVKQSALLNLAMAHQHLQDNKRASEVAADAIREDKRSTAALQAEAIIIELKTDDLQRFKKLKILEETCRKSKSFVTANNIALVRARAPENSSDLDNIIDEVLQSSRVNKDFYNGTRAIIKLCELIIKRGDKITAAQKSQLINAYQFLFNQRLPALFDKCHNALWKAFDDTGDVDNLLRLFRHSSFIWRLGGDLDREGVYLKRLASHIHSSPAQDLRQLDRETAYFLVRASAAVALMGPGDIGPEALGT